MNIKKNYWIGKHGPMMIAEIGANHEGNFSSAKKLVKLAIKANVDVIKFQLYTGEGIVNKKISPERHKHFSKFQLTKEQHIELAKIISGEGKLYSTSRYMPESNVPPIQFNKITQKAVKPAASEISKNSRARSAKLRVARRTNFKPGKNLTLDELSVPIVGAN